MWNVASPVVAVVVSCLLAILPFSLFFLTVVIVVFLVVSSGFACAAARSTACNARAKRALAVGAKIPVIYVSNQNLELRISKLHLKFQISNI